MTGLTMYRCLTIWVIVVIKNVTSAQIPKTEIISGVNALQGTLEEGATLIEKLKPMEKSLELFGAYFTFIMGFVPSLESKEMRYMKEKFAQMGTKLDRISNQIDNPKALVTFETQRTAYVHSAKKILSGYNKLKDFQNELSVQSSCSTRTDCERERLIIAERYVDGFNVKEDLHKIMRGTSGPGIGFCKPLLDLVNEYNKCDTSKVLDFANDVIGLAYKGQHAVLAYESLIGSNRSLSTVTREWSEMAYNIKKKTDEIKVQCNRDI